MASEASKARAALSRAGLIGKVPSQKVAAARAELGATWEETIALISELMLEGRGLLPKTQAFLGRTKSRA